MVLVTGQEVLCQHISRFQEAVGQTGYQNSLACDYHKRLAKILHSLGVQCCQSSVYSAGWITDRIAAYSIILVAVLLSPIAKAFCLLNSSSSVF